MKKNIKINLKKNPAPIYFLELENLIGQEVEIRINDDYGGKLIIHGTLKKSEYSLDIFQVEEYLDSYVYTLVKFTRFQIKSLIKNIITLNSKNTQDEKIYDFNFLENIFKKYDKFAITINREILKGCIIFFRISKKIKYNKDYDLFYYYLKDKLLLNFTLYNIKNIYLPFDPKSRYSYPEIDIEL